MPMKCEGCGAEFWSGFTVAKAPPGSGQSDLYSCTPCWHELFLPLQVQARKLAQASYGWRPYPPAPLTYPDEPPHRPYGWMQTELDQ